MPYMKILEAGVDYSHTWDEIEDKVRSMRNQPGNEYTLDILIGEDSELVEYMILSGGNNRFLLYYYAHFYNGMPTHQLTDLSQVEPVDIVAGGVQMYVPEPRYAVSIQTGLSALEYYYDYQDLNPDLDWEEF